MSLLLRVSFVLGLVGSSVVVDVRLERTVFPHHDVTQHLPAHRQHPVSPVLLCQQPTFRVFLFVDTPCESFSLPERETIFQVVVRSLMMVSPCSKTFPVRCLLFHVSSHFQHRLELPGVIPVQTSILPVYIFS